MNKLSCATLHRQICTLIVIETQALKFKAFVVLGLGPSKCVYFTEVLTRAMLNILAQYALSFAPGIFMGRLFDIGYFEIPTFVASATLIVLTFLVAQCTEYWQFLLCQGLASGVSSLPWFWYIRYLCTPTSSWLAA